ncbi:MAG: hypothetical protein FWD55_07210 [Propionibacteriaceae bacterium]|nr:hypothetical protein [Propionibacteriaceae bacterium]
MSSYQPYMPPPTAVDAQQPTLAPDYGQQSWAANQYPVQPQNTVWLGEHPGANTIFVLGLLSLIVFSPLGPFAWYKGNKAKKECEAGWYILSGNLQAGRIMGMIASIVLMVSVGMFFLFMLSIVIGVFVTY